jgi:thiosulfate dehydrogenase [quinone] large subunit
MSADSRRDARLPRQVAILRMVFGVIWAIDALFKWRPTFLHTYLAQVEAAQHGQPVWLLPLFRGAETVIRLDPYAFALATAIIESLTALGLILGLARRLGYLVGAGFGVLVWIFAEGFGGPYTAGSTDIGAGIIYAVVFLALYGLDRAVGPGPWAVDTWIARRRRGWMRVAEPAAPDQPAPMA